MKKIHQQEAEKVEKALSIQDVKVNQTITAFLTSRNAQQDGAGDGHIAQLSGAFKPKVEALMPPTLTEENTPAEYKVWKRKWDSYYKATGKHNSVLSVQRTFLESFLNAHLVNLLGEEAWMARRAALRFWTRSSTGFTQRLCREPNSGLCVRSRASVIRSPWPCAGA